MTPTPVPPSDADLSLLALADGELDGTARADAEARAATDPAAGELLRDLEATGPANREPWAAARPPEPTDAQWASVRNGIAAKVWPAVPTALKPVNSRWRTVRYALAGVCALAAAVLLVLRLAGVFPQPPAKLLDPPPLAVQQPAPTPPADDPLAEFAVLPIATADDVMVSALRDDRSFQLVAVDHPLPPRMPLATAADFKWVGGDGGQMFTPLTPDDAPVPAVPSPSADK